MNHNISRNIGKIFKILDYKSIVPTKFINLHMNRREKEWNGERK